MEKKYQLLERLMKEMDWGEECESIFDLGFYHIKLTIDKLGGFNDRVNTLWSKYVPKKYSRDLKSNVYNDCSDLRVGDFYVPDRIDNEYN